jgi:hypothetical protein
MIPMKNNMNTQSEVEFLFKCGASLRIIPTASPEKIIRTPPAMLLW